MQVFTWENHGCGQKKTEFTHRRLPGKPCVYLEDVYLENHGCGQKKMHLPCYIWRQTAAKYYKLKPCAD